MGNTQTVQRIGEIRKRFHPDIFFLSETMNTNDVVLRKFKSSDLVNSHLVSPTDQRGGGLALFWKAEIELIVLNTCKNYIDTTLRYEGKVFYATFIYGDPDIAKRRLLWRELADLAGTREGAWFVTGDFNDILNNQEKEGGVVRTEGSFTDFRSFVAECDLYDIHHAGDFLSWRGVTSAGVVRSRLDRAMANSDWFECFASGHLEYLNYEGSDHKPIITCFDVTRKKGKGLFRFDRRLKNNPLVKEIVANAWKGHRGEEVAQKLSQVRGAIVKWNKEQQANSRTIIEKHKEALEEAMVSPQNDGDRIASINQELKEAYKAEEEYWRQGAAYCG